MKAQQYLDEVKSTQINVGKSFTLAGDIGNFKKGEKVEVTNISSLADDIEIELTNDKGDVDVFYLDKNDDFEELT